MQTKSKKIAIPLFKRDHLISKDFFFGLLFALAFHLSLLFLFRATPISSPEEIAPLPFTQVEAMVTAPKRKTLPMKSHILPLFSKKVPSFKELPFPTTEIESGDKEARSFDPDFSSLEKIPYSPPLSHDF